MKNRKLTRQPHFLMDNWYLLKKKYNNGYNQIFRRVISKNLKSIFIFKNQITDTYKGKYQYTELKNQTH